MRCTYVLPLVAFLIMSYGAPVESAPGGLPRLKVSENKRFLVTESGEPFFYAADTAWELFHRLDRKEAVHYLATRARQHFNVVQAVALAELEGLVDPNANGDLPLIDKDPTKPWVTPGNRPDNAAAYDYWDHVDFVIDEANKRGIYVGLLPTWGAWVSDEKTKIFTPENARVYGEFLGKRYAHKGVIWVLGGDRVCPGTEPVWRTMAEGITKGAAMPAGSDTLLVTFHPRGGGTSSECFHQDNWLDFNMQQTGHQQVERTRGWRKIRRDYNMLPIKPVLDGEPLYEDIAITITSNQWGYAFDAHARQRWYWHVFAGALGQTYGNNSVWQMFAPGRKPTIGPILTWSEALQRPAANQMQHLRALIESRPFLSRVPAPEMLEDELEGVDHLEATRGDGYAFVYAGTGKKIQLKLGIISGAEITAWWFNPRTGNATKIGTFPNQGSKEFASIAEGFGADWVLVIDDRSKNFRAPGAPGPLVR